MPAALRTGQRRWPAVGVETLALLVVVFFSLASNTLVWRYVLEGRGAGDPATWRFAASVFVALTAFQFVFLAAVLTRRTARITLSLLLLATAFASYYAQRYAVFLDPTMLRNVLRTDHKEAAELLSWDLLRHLALHAALPIWIVWHLPIVDLPWRNALWRRGLWMLGGVALTTAGVMASFQDIAAIARNHRDYRFLVAPSNFVYSLARVATGDARTAARPLVPVGEDAALAPSWQARARPALLVVVVGETARAANWGLNGYARQTTPELAGLDVINFRDVVACGTSTETSLPCMFSPWGRRDYDEGRIRSHQSLLHVLQRAGLDVLWRDNQSGCKRVCDGLKAEQLDTLKTPGLCADGRCLDEVLLQGLEPTLADTGKSHVLVLHQLGSHGPAYHKRYPPELRRYTPTCDTGDLRQCTAQQIVNAYDNSILYTDRMLARTIELLQAEQKRYDTALIYVSDHGESLGEHGLFLHGLPYAIAPAEQTRVPMLMWLSPGFKTSFGIDLECLRARAAQPASHDHLFHTVLGLLDVRTKLRDAAWDLTQPCRPTDG